MGEDPAIWIGKDEHVGVLAQPRKDLKPPPHWRLEAITATERPRSLAVAADRARAVFIQDRDTSDVWILDLRPDAAIVDIRLPDGTGFDVLAQVKQKAPQIAVVLMTAFTDGEYAELSRKLGADFFFHKSTGLRDMFEAVRELANGRRKS